MLIPVDFCINPKENHTHHKSNRTPYFKQIAPNNSDLQVAMLRYMLAAVSDSAELTDAHKVFLPRANVGFL